MQYGSEEEYLADMMDLINEVYTAFNLGTIKLNDDTADLYEKVERAVKTSTV